jgi:hypothetical protein
MMMFAKYIFIDWKFYQDYTITLYHLEVKRGVH